jgi:hypothetical protein
MVHWDAYTVCSVLSGVMLVLFGLLSTGTKARDRLRIIVSGAVLAGYGLYVAHQTSGVFFFGAGIFIIPVLSIVYLVVKTYAAANRGPTRSAGRAGQQCERCGTAISAPARACTRCGHASVTS